MCEWTITKQWKFMEALIALVALAIFLKLHLFWLKVGGKITITKAIYLGC
jgi:hypothetical protein